MIEKLKFLNSMGVSMEAIAKGIGTTRGTVNNWLKGTKNMSAASETKVATYLADFRKQIDDTL